MEPSPSRFDLIEELITLCKKDGFHPNEEKLRKTLSSYNTPDIERVLDACYRFGFRNIIENI